MIDEKGRLFGKINIVDLLVILVILIGAAVVAVKFLGPGSTAAINPVKTHVTYQVLVEGVQPEVYENVQKHIPGTLMASGEFLDGQVTAVTSAPHEGQVTIGSSGGQDVLMVPVDDGLLDLTFTIKCNVVNPVTTEIGPQEVRIGKTHIVKTDKFELSSGVIIDCVWGDGAAE